MAASWSPFGPLSSVGRILPLWAQQGLLSGRDFIALTINHSKSTEGFFLQRLEWAHDLDFKCICMLGAQRHTRLSTGASSSHTGTNTPRLLCTQRAIAPGGLAAFPGKQERAPLTSLTESFILPTNQTGSFLHRNKPHSFQETDLYRSVLQLLGTTSTLHKAKG